MKLKMRCYICGADNWKPARWPLKRRGYVCATPGCGYRVARVLGEENPPDQGRNRHPD